MNTKKIIIPLFVIIAIGLGLGLYVNNNIQNETENRIVPLSESESLSQATNADSDEEVPEQEEIDKNSENEEPQAPLPPQDNNEPKDNTANSENTQEAEQPNVESSEPVVEQNKEENQAPPQAEVAETPEPVQEEAAPEEPEVDNTRTGAFTVIDFFHSAEGTATVNPETNQLVLSNDFSSKNGPDLFVYLSKNRDITKSNELGEHISLGELKSLTGSQNYQLPSDFEDYESVVIWCRAFGVLFSSATLN